MTKKSTTTFLLIITLSLFTAGELFASSSFVLKKREHMLFGHSFDFAAGEGHITVNKRAQLKTALIAPPEQPISWVSKYGSLTFNLVGREFPFGGMNEAGLTIGVMVLPEADYGAVDSRYGLMEVQWIQYQLDNFATVDELLASLNTVRISAQSFGKVHFLVADRKGKIAAVEFIKGKLKSYTGRRLREDVLTNSSYRDSLRYLRGKLKPANSWHECSLTRFEKAVEMLDNFDKKSSKGDAIAYSFEILHSIRLPGATRWNMVYDIKELKIHYRTELNPLLRELNLQEIDFSPNTPRLYLDVDHPTGLPFQPYSPAVNKALQEIVFEKSHILARLPLPMRDALLYYPETVKPVR